MHSAETKAKISAALKRAQEEGRRGKGKPFIKGDGRQRGGKHSPGCQCVVHGGRGTEAQIASGRSLLAAARTPERQRARRASLSKMENDTAKHLSEGGYEVFWPLAVCDRIAIKDGCVYFVEFKKPGQKLQPSQERVRTMTPSNYIVMNYVVDIE